MPNLLQSAGTNAKQKKVQGPTPKNGESAGTNDIFKPNFFYAFFLQPWKIKEIFLLKLKPKNQRSNALYLNLKSY